MIFVNRIIMIVAKLAPSPIRIGNISSEVDKYIDINVPKEIIRVAYKLVAITEKPHCGTAPNIEPRMGPYLPDFFIFSLPFFCSLCSIYSMIKNATNKKGNNFNVSINVSKMISVI